MNSFYHKLGSFPWFYKISSISIPYVFVLAFIFLIIGLGWGILYSPTDLQQGDVYRIIYMHVPAASVSQSIYYTMTVAAAVSIIWKMKMAGVFIKAMAPIGASFTALALISGAIWGQPTWGTWWVWDARLTSTLVLFLFYLVIIGLYSSFNQKKSADTAVSILTLVGAVNLPIIKKSVDWWNTLHQPATIKITESSSIATEMLIPLLISIIGFYLFVLLSGLIAIRAEIAQREINKEWFKRAGKL
ncbi:MAG: heme ABC transporter permease [Flavobacteriaceae bacterium]|nr:heme ABC transporter permease [Flavobacteriaceae bacterium]